MAYPPLSDELAWEAAEAYRAAGNNALAAGRALNVTRGCFENRLRTAAMRGFLGTNPVLPGFKLKSTSVTTDASGAVVRTSVKQVQDTTGEQFKIPEGHRIKGVSALVDANGDTIQTWIKTREGQLDPLALADRLKEAFKNYKPAAKPVKSPKTVEKDLMTVVPANDWHIGMYGWEKEVGTNWDLRIATQTIGKAVEDTIARSPASDTCIILGGGDLLHADNSNNETARSSNQLDVDGRYPKVVEAAGMLMVRTIDAARRRHKKVIVRILPGNHDEHSAIAIAYFLYAWFRNDPRVTVDTDPSLYFWHRFGSVMIGATHGHTVKIKDMPSIMAHRRAEDWGATKFRYVHGFHLHHTAKIATEGGGCICEVHQAPIPQDAWHYGAGFLSGRSLQAITYHRNYGEIGRVRTAILDGSK